MVVEQAPGIEHTVAALEHLTQAIQKTAPVHIVGKDGAAFDAASDNVVHRIGVIEVRLSGASILTRGK